jgi:hypothetical protein
MASQATFAPDEAEDELAEEEPEDEDRSVFCPPEPSPPDPFSALPPFSDEEDEDEEFESAAADDEDVAADELFLLSVR